MPYLGVACSFAELYEVAYALKLLIARCPMGTTWSHRTLRQEDPKSVDTGKLRSD